MFRGFRFTRQRSWDTGRIHMGSDADAARNLLSRRMIVSAWIASLPETVLGLYRPTDAAQRGRKTPSAGR